jgi:hypothetical protein
MELEVASLQRAALRLASGCVLGLASNRDNSLTIAYHVSQALGTLWHALRSVCVEGIRWHAIDACGAAQICCLDIDCILAHGKKSMTAVRPSAQSPRRFQLLLEQLQLRSLRELRCTPQLSQEVIDRMRGGSIEFAYELDLVLPVCAEEIGWELSGKFFSDSQVDRASYLYPDQLKMDFGPEE